MGTSREDIEGWFKEGKRQRASHMIVVCDTFDHGDYPVYVKGGEDKAREKYDEYNKKEMQRVMEVYHLGSDMRTQLDQHRSFNFAPIATPKHAGKGPAKFVKPRTRHETFLERLAALSKDAQRNVSGDIEWDARKLRTVIDSTRTLCNEVDRYIAEIVKGTLEP